MKKVRRWYWSYFFKPRNRNESNSQVMAKVTETSLMYMTGSDSCQIKSCQHKTICGEEGDMLWPTTIQMYNTGKLRFLSNGISWEDALRVTKSGSYPSRGGAATVGNPGRQWCGDTSWQNQQIKHHVQQMKNVCLLVALITPVVVRSRWLLVSQRRQLRRDVLSPYHRLSL